MAVRLTKEGYEKLREELKYLKSFKRQEVIKAISEARAHGDLRENAEYDSAKQSQHNLETRISELEIKLADVSLIDEDSMDKNTVYLGATVFLQDVERNREVKYMLVSKEEADLKVGKISSDSPVGRQLLGKKVGDTAEIIIPAGTTRYKVLKIERG